MKTLEDYISDISEAVDEPIEVVAEKKKIGRPKGAKNMKYHFCSTFNSLSEAKEIVTMEKIWLFNLRSILTKNNNPNSIPPLVFEGEAPKTVPRGRGRPRGSKNKPKSSLL